MSVTVSEQNMDVEAVVAVPAPAPVEPAKSHLSSKFAQTKGVNARDLQAGDLIFVHRMCLKKTDNEVNNEASSKRHGIATVVQVNVEHDAIAVNFTFKKFENGHVPTAPDCVCLAGQPVEFLQSAKLLTLQEIEALPAASLVFVGPRTQTAKDVQDKKKRNEGRYGMASLVSVKGTDIRVIFNEEEHKHAISANRQDLFLCELAATPPRPLLAEETQAKAVPVEVAKPVKNEKRKIESTGIRLPLSPTKTIDAVTAPAPSNKKARMTIFEKELVSDLTNLQAKIKATLACLEKGEAEAEAHKKILLHTFSYISSTHLTSSPHLH